MKLSILASFFLAGSAIAASAGGNGGSGGTKTIDDNDSCQADSKTEFCKSGLCIQEPDQPSGTCRPKGKD